MYFADINRSRNGLPSRQCNDLQALIIYSFFFRYPVLKIIFVLLERSIYPEYQVTPPHLDSSIYNDC